MKTSFFTIAIFCLFIFSCAPKLNKQKNSNNTTKATPPIPPTPPNPPNNANIALVKGENLYTNNCGKCHKLYNPTDFNAEQWDNNLNKMQGKAKITDEQKLLIKNYLVSVK